MFHNHFNIIFLSVIHYFCEICCKGAIFFLILQTNMQLPDDFVSQTRVFFGEERFECFMKALDEGPSVSVRLNSRKFPSDILPQGSTAWQPVPWCNTGYYLSTRPNFTFDPLLHAGAYYVQEASSMFIDHVIRQYVKEPVCMLDLCAAPGGKSTAARAALPQGSLLVANEPVRQRASVLLENMVKWGWADCFVTNNYPHDFRKTKCMFDVILCDVPCSGEGMFRKDPNVIGEWSRQQVKRCQKLQREIVGDAWQCLCEGGIFIYSTCTYNIFENEENVSWMMEEMGAEVLPVEVSPEWNITGALLEGFSHPVCHFIPGFTRGEGLFMAVMRKAGHSKSSEKHIRKSLDKLNIMPSPMSGWTAGAFAEVDYKTAVSYLRGEAIILPPEVPKGYVSVTFRGLPLGFVKNIGNRANNLYPKEWRIKSTHIPEQYETIS
jgi:16S rRNA C967 or C1407 C5-methylase (RsmB/RsmF family)